MPAEYTGITLTAGEGLLKNQGLRTPPAFYSAVSNYQSVTAVAEFRQVLDQANLILDTGSYQSLASVGSNTFPALTDALGNDFIEDQGISFRSGNLSGLSGLTVSRADFWLGSGDLSKFAQYLSASEGFTGVSNDYAAAAMNSDNNLAVMLYPGTNSYITGGFSDMSSDLRAFGQDLSKLGSLLDFTRISDMGLPIVVLNRMYMQGGVPNGVVDALVAEKIGLDYMAGFKDSSFTGLDIDNQLAYDAFKNITGGLLSQCLAILGVTTVGIKSLADVLNPLMIFPVSSRYLTVRVRKNLMNIYVDGAVNSSLPVFGYRLDEILPPDQAQAWLALARGFTAIKGLYNSTAGSIGPRVAALENVNDLPLIARFQEPVPTDVRTYWMKEFSIGTGPGNTVQAWDILGTAIGDPETQDFNAIAPVLATANVDVLINVSTGIYTVMSNVLAGDYGPVSGTITIPPGLPAAGTYANANLAFTTGLVPVANSAVANIATGFSSTQDINRLWANIQYQIYRENQFIDISNLIDNVQADSETSTLGLTSSLHRLGETSDPRGYRTLIGALADLDSVYGQAVEAALREGRNLVVLDFAGIYTDNALNPNL